MPTAPITRNEQTRSGDMDDSDEAEEDGFVGADSNGPQVIPRSKCTCSRQYDTLRTSVSGFVFTMLGRWALGQGVY